MPNKALNGHNEYARRLVKFINSVLDVTTLGLNVPEEHVRICEECEMPLTKDGTSVLCMCPTIAQIRTEALTWAANYCRARGSDAENEAAIRCAELIRADIERLL